MPTINCKKCGTVFRGGLSDVLCPPCKEEEVELFQKVRDYLRNNPGANAEEIAAGTGVDERVIMRLINQGRLLRK